MKRYRWLYLGLSVAFLAACSTDSSPNAPSDVTATAGTNQIVVSWTDNSDDEAGFRIYRDSVSTSALETQQTEIAEVAANVTSYTDTDVMAGVSYTYSVSAFNEDGDESDLEEQQGDPVSPEAEMTNTIADIVVSGDDFDTLEAAVLAVGLETTLSSAGPFTVFAPTDEAFGNLPDGVLDSLLQEANDATDKTQTTLYQILLYHTVSGAVASTTLLDAVPTNIETVEGSLIAADVIGGNLTLNGDAEVTQADVSADNGVIHVINEVLLPEDAPESIVEIVVGSDDFETLEAALTQANLVDTLSGEGPFTVFAPTDDAFAKLAALPEGEVLANTLLYHVIPGEFGSSDLSDGQLIQTAFESASVEVSITNDGVFLVDNTDNVIAVTMTDISATNGVIHVIDTVLTAPGTIAEIAAADGRFTQLLAALTATDLAGGFADASASPTTVFAPVDDAFVALLGALELADLNALVDTLGLNAVRDILLYHVVDGSVSAGQAISAATDGTPVATLLTGESLMLMLTEQNGLTIANPASPLGDAEVIITNIKASNGIIHVIDKVLLVPEADTVELQVRNSAVYGDYLTDADGNSLYLFTQDAAGESACVGGCASNWPPLLAMIEDISAGEGTDARAINTIEREDPAGTQVTYNDAPLYFFSGDAAAGDANGQGVGGVWFLIDPDGNAIETLP
ncbi:MAG: fasciclin domain-containing protein [Deinococcota bacterium]